MQKPHDVPLSEQALRLLADHGGPSRQRLARFPRREAAPAAQHDGDEYAFEAMGGRRDCSRI